jgi:hypothetical protein
VFSKLEEMLEELEETFVGKNLEVAEDDNAFPELCALCSVRFEVYYEPDWHDWLRETCDASGRALICISAMENLIRGGLKITREILHGSFFFKKKAVPHFAQLGRYEFFR